METFDESGLVGDQRWFYHWIIEREKCRVGNENGLPKPWSNDPILQSYRFCNVEREKDTVSKWINDNWMVPYDDVDPERMVFAMTAARLFNRISTLKLVGFPEIEYLLDDWLEHARTVTKQARDRGEKIWTGAYLVSTNGHSMDKVDFIIDRVLRKVAQKVRAPHTGETLQSYHLYLMLFDGLGSFMAGQVIADLKYTSVLRDASDHHTWAPIGPGSKRGLNRYFGRPLEGNIKDVQVLEQLNMVQLQVRNRLGIDIAVHNIQNCFCEYDKFVRVMKGEGKPRSLYSGRS